MFPCDPTSPCGVLFYVMLLNLNWTQRLQQLAEISIMTFSVLWQSSEPFRLMERWMVDQICHVSTLGKVHTRKHSQASINLRRDVEDGLDSDVINLLEMQGVCQRWNPFRVLWGWNLSFSDFLTRPNLKE